MINTIMEMTAIKGLARKAALGLAVGMLLLAPVAAEAHCDTMDGPTVKDALKAMETDNVNYALKWVQPRYEGEVIRAFNLSMKVKDINADTRIWRSSISLKSSSGTTGPERGRPLKG